MQLIGQAHALKKSDAIYAAEVMAKEGKVWNKLGWRFEDRGTNIEDAQKVKVTKNNKDATGPLPLLTHALAVEEKAAARLAWIEWFSEEKEV